MYCIATLFTILSDFELALTSFVSFISLVPQRCGCGPKILEHFCCCCFVALLFWQHFRFESECGSDNYSDSTKNNENQFFSLDNSIAAHLRCSQFNFVYFMWQLHSDNRGIIAHDFMGACLLSLFIIRLCALYWFFVALKIPRHFTKSALAHSRRLDWKFLPYECDMHDDTALWAHEIGSNEHEAFQWFNAHQHTISVWQRSFSPLQIVMHCRLLRQFRPHFNGNFIT